MRWWRNNEKPGQQKEVRKVAPLTPNAKTKRSGSALALADPAPHAGRAVHVHSGRDNGYGQPQAVPEPVVHTLILLPFPLVENVESELVRETEDPHQHIPVEPRHDECLDEAPSAIVLVPKEVR